MTTAERNLVAVAGDSRDRVYHIECLNGYGQTPTIRFDEERRTILSDGESVEGRRARSQSNSRRRIELFRCAIR